MKIVREDVRAVKIEKGRSDGRVPKGRMKGRERRLGIQKNEGCVRV